MLVAEQLWIMSLDDRGGPRISPARAAVVAGLMLDLESARLIEWSDDAVRRLPGLAPAGLLAWAWAQLADFDEPLAAKFAIDTLYDRAWEAVGDYLVEQGSATCERRGLRRRPHYRLVDTALRTRIVREARAVLFDIPEQEAAQDERIAVLSACSIGEEMLSLTLFTDTSVGDAFGSGRGEGPLEAKVWAAVKHECFRYYRIPIVTGTP